MKHLRSFLAAAGMLRAARAAGLTIVEWIDVELWQLELDLASGDTRRRVLADLHDVFDDGEVSS